MSRQPDSHLRAHLPIPEVPRPGPTTFDAKDPDTDDEGPPMLKKKSSGISKALSGIISSIRPGDDGNERS